MRPSLARPKPLFAKTALGMAIVSGLLWGPDAFYLASAWLGVARDRATDLQPYEVRLDVVRQQIDAARKQAVTVRNAVSKIDGEANAQAESARELANKIKNDEAILVDLHRRLSSAADSQVIAIGEKEFSRQQIELDAEVILARIERYEREMARFQRRQETLMARKGALSSDLRDLERMIDGWRFKFEEMDDRIDDHRLTAFAAALGTDGFLETHSKKIAGSIADLEEDLDVNAIGLSGHAVSAKDEVPAATEIARELKLVPNVLERIEQRVAVSK